MEKDSEFPGVPRLGSKLKIELTAAVRAEWMEFRPPFRPGKEAGTEADVLGPAPRPSSGTEIKAWPRATAS